jgi:hypothetical protein
MRSRMRGSSASPADRTAGSALAGKACWPLTRARGTPPAGILITSSAARSASRSAGSCGWLIRIPSCCQAWEGQLHGWVPHRNREAVPGAKILRSALVSAAGTWLGRSLLGRPERTAPPGGKEATARAGSVVLCCLSAVVSGETSPACTRDAFMMVNTHPPLIRRLKLRKCGAAGIGSLCYLTYPAFGLRISVARTVCASASRACHHGARRYWRESDLYAPGPGTPAACRARPPPPRPA